MPARSGDSHLAHLAPGLRLMAIRHNPDLHTWGMFDLLLMEAKRVAPEQPLESLDLAYAALAVTDLLSPETYDPERIHDLRARAWAYLGNAKRLAGDFPGARRPSAPQLRAWSKEAEIPMRKRTSCR